jgi:small subunit ribosomal protein S6
MEESLSGLAPSSVSADSAPISAAEPIPSMEETGPIAPPAPVVEIPIVEGGRRYETLVLIPIRFEGPAFEPLSADIRKIYEAEGAAIASIDVIGRRQLAYKVQKQTEGVYVNFVFSALPAAIASIERDLRHMESIMRFLTTVKE